MWPRLRLRKWFSDPARCSTMLPTEFEASFGRHQICSSWSDSTAARICAGKTRVMRTRREFRMRSFIGSGYQRQTPRMFQRLGRVADVQHLHAGGVRLLDDRRDGFVAEVGCDVADERRQDPPGVRLDDA